MRFYEIKLEFNLKCQRSSWVSRKTPHLIFSLFNLKLLASFYLQSRTHLHNALSLLVGRVKEWSKTMKKTALILKILKKINKIIIMRAAPTVRTLLRRPKFINNIQKLFPILIKTTNVYWKAEDWRSWLKVLVILQIRMRSTMTRNVPFAWK